jgi:hypothetical protein
MADDARQWLMGTVGAVRRKMRAGPYRQWSKIPAPPNTRGPTRRPQKKRLGHRFRDAEPPAGDWTDNAFRLGKSLRRGYKRRGAVEVNVFGALGGRAWCRRLRSCSGRGLRLAVHPVFVGGCILPLCVHDLQ